MKNFNLLIATLLISISFVACSKNDYVPYDGQKYLDLEAPILEEYADSLADLLGKEAHMHEETGIWYIIEEEGLTDPESDGFYEYNVKTQSGQQVIEAPLITVDYIGKLVYTGAKFDEGEINEKSLGGYLYAWQLAFLPKEFEIDGEYEEIENFSGFTELGLQQGAKIRIVVPSPFAYQDQPRNGIPANSPLDFSIEVHGVEAP